jgi:hypothetical protein
MWLSKPVPTQRQPHEDPIEWAHKETMAFTSWKCRVYGAASVLNLLLITPLFAGMPFHSLWPILGIPLMPSFCFVFGALLFFAAVAVGEIVGWNR